MNEAIRLAIEKGGYGNLRMRDSDNWTLYHQAGWIVVNTFTAHLWVTKDPLFWQTLGKALGWEPSTKHFIAKDGMNYPQVQTWFYHAHKYFDLLLTGGDEEKFWKQLLTSGQC